MTDVNIYIFRRIKGYIGSTYREVSTVHKVELFTIKILNKAHSCETIETRGATLCFDCNYPYS